MNRMPDMRMSPVEEQGATPVQLDSVFKAANGERLSKRAVNCNQPFAVPFPA